MCSFTSTRGSLPVSLAEALSRGLAPDGGLYVPSDLARLPDAPPSTEDLLAISKWALPSLFPGVPADLLGTVVSDALSFPMPLVEVEPGVHVLELFHGPTHAFKDVGARFLARLMRAVDRAEGRRTVLVATSGDTGGAVADAFADLGEYDVVILFPRDGVSPLQRRQMTTRGGNVNALAVAGSFDDCQRLAKQAFLDPGLSHRYGLTSANSINVGRLLPQALYYVYAAALLGWDKAPVRFVVPSGNLGNLSAGLIAMRMGMPPRQFVAATNVNRVFVDMLEGGSWEPRPAIPTASSAMDVGYPSNLERIQWLYSGDLEGLRNDVVGVSVSDESARACIRETYERTGYVMDPHTAVAYEAHRRHCDDGPGPSVVLATAHPAKFPKLTEAAIGHEIPLPDGLARTLGRKEHLREVAPTLPALVDALERMPAR